MLPDRYVPLRQQLTAPDVVDQHVEPAVLGVDSGRERLHLPGLQMIDLDRNTLPAGRGDRLGRLFNGFRTVVLRSLCSGRTPGAVDRGTGGPELDGDAPPCAARGSGHQRNLANERACHLRVSEVRMAAQSCE